MSQNTLNKVYIELTRACNLSCTHCLNNSGVAGPNELTFDEVADIINQLSNLKAREIRFTGGEPTIDRAIYRYISHASALGIRTSIGTNAVAITPEVSHKLKQAGLTKAIVSLDGNEDSHDAVRGPGSYRRSVRGVIALRDAGVNVRINAVAMRSTYNGLEDLAKTCAELRVSLFVRRFIPSGRAKESLSEFLNRVEYQELKKILREHIEQGVVEGHHLGEAHGSCSAGTTGFGINPNGEIYRCGFLDAQGDQSFGNIRNTSLSVSWQRMQGPALHDQLKNLVEDVNNDFPERPRTNCPATSSASSLVQIRRK